VAPALRMRQIRYSLYNLESGIGHKI
jgi:hypothetical protein